MGESVDDEVRTRLAAFVDQHGLDALIGDAQRCRAVLRDVLWEDEHRMATNLLSTAAEAGVPQRLASAPAPDVVARPLAEQLVASYGIDSDNAAGAVATWAFVVTGRALEGRRQPSTQPERLMDPDPPKSVKREREPADRAEDPARPSGRIDEVAQGTVADLKRALPALSKAERQELLVRERATRGRKTAIAAIESSLAPELQPAVRNARAQDGTDALGWALAVVAAILLGVAAVIGVPMVLSPADGNFGMFMLVLLLAGAAMGVGAMAYERLTGKRAPWD